MMLSTVSGKARAAVCDCTKVVSATAASPAATRGFCMPFTLGDSGVLTFTSRLSCAISVGGVQPLVHDFAVLDRALPQPPLEHVAGFLQHPDRRGVGLERHGEQTSQVEV